MALHIGHYALMRRWVGAVRPARVFVGLVVVLLVVGGIMAGRRPHPETDDPTPKTSHFTWTLQVLGDEGDGYARFDVDQDTGRVRLTLGAHPDEHYFIDGSRVLLPAGDAFAASDEIRYVSAPVSVLFPPGINLAAAEISPSLSRRPRECSHSSAIETRYVQFFLKRVPDWDAGFQICGTSTTGGSFVNGRNIRAAEDYRASAFEWPDSAEVARVEDLGSRGDAVVEVARNRLAE